MLIKYKNDIIVVSIILVIAVFIFVFLNFSKEKGNAVVVTIDDKIYEIYDLNENITVELHTGNTLVIKDNEAYISKSTCKDKVCINHGRISAVGETIICLPHKLVIEVKEADFDE